MAERFDTVFDVVEHEPGMLHDSDVTVGIN